MKEVITPSSAIAIRRLHKVDKCMKELLNQACTMERNKLLCGDVPSIQLTTLLHDIRTAMWDNQETLENEVEEAAVAHTPSSVRLTTVSRSQQTDEDLCSQTLARTDRTFAAPGEPACPRSVGRCAASAIPALASTHFGT